MENILLYGITVLIWGSTWFAITYQLNVPPELSVAYRFFLASVILFAYSKWRGLNLRFTLKEQLFIAFEGLLLFSANYILVYYSELYITSGLVAVLFTIVTLMNVVFSAIFLKIPISGRVILGSLIGILGVYLIFRPEVEGVQFGDTTLLGLIFVLVSALSASLGNVVAARNQRASLPVIQTNAYGMLYGAIATFAVALVRGVPLTFEFSIPYVTSLLYLSLFGSVIAFGAYLTLLGRIGPDRSGYVAVLFPVVALLLSSRFEGLRMEAMQFVGVALVLLGNGVVLYKRQRALRIAAVTK
jgi:drug/metabolite transporter (DMT)-like permease